MSNILVSLHNLRRQYKGEGTAFPAVQDVSFQVHQGDFVALMGQSGSGKSTLLNLIGGIDSPDAGEVWVDGVRVDQLSETKLALFRRKRIGVVFQFFNLIQNLDVVGNIELPGMLAGMSTSECRKQAESLMGSLEISPLARKMPHQLSGGQRQRVAIARALINKPALLLADEPTGALDQENGLSVLRLFQTLHEAGQTIIMVTHDHKVADFARRMLVIQDGRLVSDSDAVNEKGASLLAGTRVAGKGERQ